MSETGMPGRIRIAFPAFGPTRLTQAYRNEPQSAVSREEIAELLQDELDPVRN